LDLSEIINISQQTREGRFAYKETVYISNTGGCTIVSGIDYEIVITRPREFS